MHMPFILQLREESERLLTVQHMLRKRCLRRQPHEGTSIHWLRAFAPDEIAL